MNIVAVGSAFPENYYTQDQLLETFKASWNTSHFNPNRAEQLHKAVCVGGRHLALPIERYEQFQGFGETNDAFIEKGLDVAEQAFRNALTQSNKNTHDIDAIFVTSVTGIATPSLDALLINRMQLREDITRYPFFGLGCVAGAAGVARLHDYLLGNPDKTAVLIAVELCSLTLQKEDLSVANLISTGLFGDGAAAVIASGHAVEDSHPGKTQSTAQVVDTYSRFYPNTERVMGWDISENGFKIVLSDSVPEVVKTYIPNDVGTFLNAQNLKQADIKHWICHPGGPKILEAFEQSLALSSDALELTWDSLRSVGNISSVSVLLVLADTIAKRQPKPGEYGLMMAMGPGFCAEMVLLRW